MNDLNRAQLIGVISRKNEITTTSTGAQVANFTVKTVQQIKNYTTGEVKEFDEYTDCVYWGKEAVHFVAQAELNDKVYVEGRLKNRSFEVDGVKKYKTEISVQSYLILSGSHSGSTSQEVPESPTEAALPDVSFDDFPF